MYHYKAFNLHFITPFECPELIEIHEDNDLEKVRIEFGKTPENLDTTLNETPTFQSNNEEILLQLKTVGNYYIAHGNKIIIEKKDETISNDSIRLYLFGSAIGALLFQKGYLVLHASAIKTSKGAVLFCGNSGAGKSTTVQEFIKRGYDKLSDDTIALYYDEKEKKIMCIPSYPQSKLWQQSLDILDYKNDNLKQVNEEIEKYVYSTKDSFCKEKAISLYSIFVLSTHQKNEVKILDVNGMNKFIVVKNQTYRKRFIEKLDLNKNYLKLLTITANQSLVKQLLRPSTSNSLKEIADKIEEIIK